MFFNMPKPSSREMYPEIGSRVGKYTVVDIAGAPGGTAIVLICKDAAGKKFAVKRFFCDSISEQLKKRIHQETELNINSTYIVKSQYVFVENGFIHSVMPYIQGKSLGDVLASTPGLNEKQVQHLGKCLAIACCDLHRAGIVSTDIKPDNIIITPWDHVKLIDLTCFEKIGCAPEISLGTSPYAAPELQNRQVLSAATDIYSIGMVLYEASLGTEEFMEQMNNNKVHMFETPNPRLSEIIKKAVQANPASRYSSSRSMLNELQSLTQEQSIRSTCALIADNGKPLYLPFGKHIIGRKDIAPENYFISEEQFEIDFDGINARIRDMANKNKIYLNGATVTKNWFDIPDRNHVQNRKFKL